MTTNPNPKQKSLKRWQQGRRLYEKVCPSLPTPSHVAVLMYCWFNAYGEDCHFNVAHCQIANATKLSYERVRKIMADLVTANVVVNVKDSRGRGYAPHRRITGRIFKSNKVVTSNHPNPKEGGHT
jgi:hypothetical protein